MPSVDRRSPLPLWAQVLDDLRRRLRAGEFDGGFPTDLELTRQYRVSRHTAREAVRRLSDEGVLRRERGRGTFLAAAPIDQPTGAIYSLFRSIEARGLDQRSVVLDLSLTTDPDVAGRLRLPAGARLVRLERVRSAAGVPLAHDTAWLPAAVAEPLLDVDFTHTALYDELAARCGVRPTAGHERVTAELPTPTERRLLRIPARQPVFRIDRRGEDGDRPLEWRRTVVRADRFAFVADWSPSSTYEASLVAADGT